MSRSVTSVTWLWIWLVLCAATGEPGVLYRGSGQGVTMDCGEADPNQGFEWRVGSVMLKGMSKQGHLRKGSTAAAQRVKLSGASLMIPAVQISDSGVYTCSELDGKKSKKAQHTLHVVSVSVSPSDTVLVRTDVTLRCDVPGDPAAQVQWMKPPGGEAYGSPSNTVTLRSVTSAEAGQWVCQIGAGTEVGKVGVDIKVVGPLISPGEVVAPSGGTAELPCFLPTPSCLGIDGGGWAHYPSTDLQFPVLVREARGLRWSGTKPRVAFRDEPLSTNFTVRVENVQPSDAGQYVCTLVFQGGQSLNATLRLKVTTGEHLAPSKPSPSSPGHLEITAPLGGAAELPCTHPNSSSLRIVRGGWARVPSTEVRFPVLMSTEAKGLHWNGTGSLSAKVSFSDQQLSTNFNIKLNNVTHADAGTYVCTLMFADGGNWDTKLTLRVGGETVGVASGVRPSWIDGEFWKKPVLLGLALWIWVAIAAGSLLLIVLVVVITSVRCRRKKRGRKGEKSEVKTENYYAQESVPMQDERKRDRRPRPGMKERPLPPVPKHQYQAVKR